MKAELFAWEAPPAKFWSFGRLLAFYLPTNNPHNRLSTCTMTQTSQSISFTNYIRIKLQQRSQNFTVNQDFLYSAQGSAPNLGVNGSYGLKIGFRCLSFSARYETRAVHLRTDTGHFYLFLDQSFNNLFDKILQQRQFGFKFNHAETKINPGLGKWLLRLHFANLFKPDKSL